MAHKCLMKEKEMFDVGETEDSVGRWAGDRISLRLKASMRRARGAACEGLRGRLFSLVSGLTVS